MMTTNSIPGAQPRSRKWNVQPAVKGLSDRIAAAFSLHPAVARILVSRGWKDEGDQLADFLSPSLKGLRSPFELREMDRGVERVAAAVRNKEKICVYGDYDVDGVTSTALLVGTLRFLGANPSFAIPHRINDGYGMSEKRVEQIAKDGCTLILTVDTGVGAIGPVRRAKELGMDVVVTDHHLAGDELPETIAFINPNRTDGYYEHGRLCGVGVAFKFAHALLKVSGTTERDAKAFLMEQLDLVALGTIADVVPLTGENRIFARHGLDAIARSRRPGIRALIDVAGYSGKPITPHAVGFGLGPRLNAAGRTQDALLALKLLLSTSPTESHAIAQELDALNRERQEIERGILDASLLAITEIASLSSNAVVVAGEGWHFGVVGIVASRLTERFGVPAIVLTIEEDLARGSARSVSGFNIHEALQACSEHLETFGGHAAAAGVKLRKSKLPTFREAMNDHAGRIFSTMDRTQTLEVDTEVSAAEIGRHFYDDLQKMQPFGEGNRAPVLLLRSVESAGPPRIVGRNHLKLRLKCGTTTFDGIGFGLGHLKELFEGGVADVLFRPVENTFTGEPRIELEIVDGRRAV
ncbi:single-stranded-DNA-specific exonuclease RecJ [soil metagenome]